MPECETPKSPPGDYKRIRRQHIEQSHLLPSVKHLNPRQGITTAANEVPDARPQSMRVKHLNPRQGITTGTDDRCRTGGRCYCVKHLNPRQGITTSDLRRGSFPILPRYV